MGENQSCCLEQVQDFMGEFKSVDDDFTVRRIQNAFIIKMDGRSEGDGWISREFAVPNIEFVNQCCVSWSTAPTNE